MTTRADSPRSATSDLDAAVAAAIRDLEKRGTARPDVLFFLGTGVGMLPTSLRSAARVPLGKLAGVPRAWSDVMLHSGLLGRASIWMIEDAAGPQELGTEPPIDEPRWVRGYPCWLAASAGATLCVHTAAGVALPAESARRVAAGSLALVRDHINVSGRTPLEGLAESKLGPLFPDTSRLHHAELRANAARAGRTLGVALTEAVAACTHGPALETPAERTWWARAGADVAVQNAATTYLSCAHAGLALLSVVAVTDAGEGIGDMAAIVREAYKLAPALDDLLTSLASHLEKAAGERRAQA
jgi:purine-nucleoside phosphorylase